MNFFDQNTDQFYREHMVYLPFLPLLKYTVSYAAAFQIFIC